jgi:endonuclease/exonuclease/phosphatase family metal-dependent hydrolase
VGPFSTRKWARIARGFPVAGYEGKYASKGGGKPDGCATFLKLDTVALGTVQRLYCADGGMQPCSGHIALVTVVEHRGRQVGIVNTHLKWDPPGTPPATQVGLRQISELLDAQTGLAPGCSSWIICGDLNVTPNSPVVQRLQAAGLRDAYAAQHQAFTCNANQNARRIDFLFHSSDLVAEPTDLPIIDNNTPLPSAEQPSDHLAISARFDWASLGREE